MREELDRDICVLDGCLDSDIYSQDLAEIPSIMKRVLLRPSPQIIVLPKSKREVIKVMEYARSRKLPIVPRGVGSSAYGGVIPTDRGIVLDLSMMRSVLKFDREKKLIKVETGARWADIEEFLKGEGFSLMAYPTSWFSTVGGWVSTGGYGIHTLKFGHVRKQVDSISVVAVDGEIKKISHEDPEFEFYFGTEGQVGILLDATLKVRERPYGSFVYLFYFEEDAKPFEFIKDVLKDFGPAHMIYYDEHFIEDVNALLEERLFEETASVLLEFEDITEAEAFLGFVEGLEGIRKAPDHLSNYLWKERFFPMKAKRLGPGQLASELVIPIANAAEYLRKSSELGREYGVSIGAEAHIISRKEAFLITFFLTDKYRTFRYLRHLGLTMMLTRLGIDIGGRPYEIGIWNMPFLKYKFDKAFVSRFGIYKEKVDPDDLLNPGKLFSLKSKFYSIPIKILRPALLNPVLKLLIKMSGILFSKKALSVPEHTRPEFQDIIEEAISACARCGSCAAVCPAYLVTKDCKVTPRGKIISAKELRDGKKIPEKEVLKLFFCMRCKACEEVCQAGLKLGEVWDELERQLERDFERPSAEIEAFIKEVEESEEYKRLVEKDIGGERRV